MKSKVMVALLICGLSVGVFAANVLATPSSGVTTKILAKSLFDEFAVNAHSLPADAWQARLKTRGQSDAYVVDNKLAPGATTGWHSHPGPSLIFVLAGTVTNYTSDGEGCTGHAYSAGSGFIDPGGDEAHNVHNESATTPAETIAVQLLPSGKARRIDKPQPSDCNH
jgi:quercetin dioxygenase-like cupin family protein